MYTSVLEYIGLRTTAYGPVEITHWFWTTSIVAEANEFSLTTRYTIHMPRNTMKSPSMTSPGTMNVVTVEKTAQEQFTVPAERKSASAMTWRNDSSYSQIFTIPISIIRISL